MTNSDPDLPPDAFRWTHRGGSCSFLHGLPSHGFILALEMGLDSADAIISTHARVSGELISDLSVVAY